MGTRGGMALSMVKIINANVVNMASQVSFLVLIQFSFLI